MASAGGGRGRPSGRRGPKVGSGGQRRRGLAGRGATPPAQLRPGHPAQRRAAAATSRAERAERAARRGLPAAETVVGRNAVVEALRGGVPATTLYVAPGLDRDPRVREAVTAAGKVGVALLEVSRGELDRLTTGAAHQGVALQVPPYSYTELDDLFATAEQAAQPALLVGLDGITDPHNLGAVVRSTAAFGGHGVVLPERRAATITAAAWKASAGAAARLPVCRVTNLVRALRSAQERGLFVVGLAADGTADLDDLELAADPLMLVVGAEGRGLGRLVAQTCDLTLRIPMAGPVESLNASVAAAVALAEVARRRRALGGGPQTRL